MPDNNNYFTPFNSTDQKIETPLRFTYPFSYTPHPLTLIAAQALQDHLESQDLWVHNFGLTEESANAFGKMFGVLVVKNREGVLGYLWAFSGTLGGKNHQPHFVPPVFDMAERDDFFCQGERELRLINEQIIKLESAPTLSEAKTKLAQQKEQYQRELTQYQEGRREAKERRAAQRAELHKDLSEEEQALQNRKLIAESQQENRDYKQFNTQWEDRLNALEQTIATLSDEINRLKQFRKEKSLGLQHQLFDQYHLLNAKGEARDLFSIFANTDQGTPPAGSGDCAAPKLLQYAFQNGYQIICMAEFWYGKSPKSENRKHLEYYPSCDAKCRPILGHMLSETSMEEPSLKEMDKPREKISVVFEDDHLLVIDRPEQTPLLSSEIAFKTKPQTFVVENHTPLLTIDGAFYGLTIYAKDTATENELRDQLKSGNIVSRYLVTVELAEDKTQGAITHDEFPKGVNPQQSQRIIWKLVDKMGSTATLQLYPVNLTDYNLAKIVYYHFTQTEKHDQNHPKLKVQRQFFQIRHPFNKKKMTFVGKTDNTKPKPTAT